MSYTKVRKEPARTGPLYATRPDAMQLADDIAQKRNLDRTWVREAVGVASADEKGEAAVSCVIGALQSITFPSPGSYASKVSVTIE